MRILAILTATVAGFLCGVWCIRRKCHKDRGNIGGFGTKTGDTPDSYVPCSTTTLKFAEEYAAQLDKDLDKEAMDAWETVEDNVTIDLLHKELERFRKIGGIKNCDKYFISGWKIPENVV